MSDYKNIVYSERYCDAENEYRHVILPSDVFRTYREMQQGKTTKFLNEEEWRKLGIQQSKGWQHYLIHKSEPHVLIFKRPLETDKTK